MANKIDAVIEALRILLAEVEQRTTEYSWHCSVVNRWINQLPGAWYGRWWNLRVHSTFVARGDLITHVRMVLAYLEARRAAFAAPRRWALPKFAGRRRQSGAEPVQAPSKSDKLGVTPTPKSKWLN